MLAFRQASWELLRNSFHDDGGTLRGVDGLRPLNSEMPPVLGAIQKHLLASCSLG